jgi:hypothetical protein
MTPIHLDQRTTATHEQFLVGLTDFGPGRSEILDRVECPPDASRRVHHDEAERVAQLLTDFFALHCQ